MKLSFSTLGCPNWSLSEIIEHAARMGYDGVDFRGVGAALDITGLPEFTTGLVETRRRLADAGIAVSGVATSARGATADPMETRKHTEEVRRNVALAAELGARVVRVFGGAVPKDHTLESIRPRLVENLRMWGDEAAKFGVTIALETHDAWTDSALVAGIVEETAHAHVGVLWDLANPWFEGREPPELTCARLARYTVSTHVKDAVRTPDGKHRYVLLGEGEVPIREMLERLAHTGYRGYAVLEWEKKWHPELPEPETAFPQFVRRMREWNLAASSHGERRP